MDKIPYTKNTTEVRRFLEENGFAPLSFFTGKEYIHPIVSTFGNVTHQWLVYDYTTFDDPKITPMTYLQDEMCDLVKFISEITRLYPETTKPITN